MKSLLFLLFVTITLTNGCTKNSPSTNNPNNPPSVVYKIGDNGPAEGIIVGFDTTTTPKKYYEAKLLPTSYQWGCGFNVQFRDTIKYGNTIQGGPDGYRNTQDIIGQCTQPTMYAAKICWDYSVTKNNVIYDDWYLPSLVELRSIITTTSFSLASNTQIWTSNQSKYNVSEAYAIVIGDSGNWYSKGLNFRIIVVRKF